MNLEEAEVIGQRRMGELLYVENTIDLLYVALLMNISNVWGPDLLMRLRPAWIYPIDSWIVADWYPLPTLCPTHPHIPPAPIP